MAHLQGENSGMVKNKCLSGSGYLLELVWY